MSLYGISFPKVFNILKHNFNPLLNFYLFPICDCFSFHIIDFNHGTIFRITFLYTVLCYGRVYFSQPQKDRQIAFQG